MFVPPRAADLDRNILNHYNLQDPFPTAWPAELDESDDDDDQKVGVRRSRSRYSALERAASDRKTFLPGSQQTRDGKANLVQKDEPDPLGGQGTVIGSLRARDLPIDQDVRMRNRFLLSSTTFSPATFLAVTHAEDSTDDLIRGLQFLSRSIDQKSASLKVLVETNFERFVRAKATIDNVYTEMRNQGLDTAAANLSPPSPRSNRHSRHFSRNSGFHQRITSSGSAAPPPQPSKNALRKETEYGVQGVKGPLLEVTQRAEDVWGPALGGREREATLKAVVEAVERERPLYELGGEMSSAIQQRAYDRVVELYNTARTYANQATALGERASETGQTLTDDQIHKLLVTGRMWGDVQEQVESVKRDIWKRLGLQNANAGPILGQAEEHIELISVLLELGVDDNPIWVWLFSRYDQLKVKIAAVTERSKVEIEILRRRLAAAEHASPEVTASFLRSVVKDPPEQPDADQVIDFWKTISTYVSKLVSLTDGLLAEVIDFWDAAKSFIDGNKQQTLPTGYEGESRKHHRLSDAGVQDLSKGTVELVNMIREAVMALFAESPTEDISSLLSPAPESAKNGNMTPKTPLSPVFSPSEGRLGSIDALNIPPPSPHTGELWEDLAFWPPHSNALSAVQYLTEILVMIGAGAGEMAALDPLARNASSHDKIGAMLNSTRDRCLRAVCDAWEKDISKTQYLEDWLRSPEKRNQTRLPAYFIAYEKTVVNGVQHILYFTEAITKPASRVLVTAPSQKMIQSVRLQFTQGILNALKGMQECAESSVKSDDDEWVAVSNAFESATLDGAAEVASYSIDASHRSVRILLTLSNLKALRTEHVPLLIQQFESAFSVKITDETKQINDRFGQTDTELFHSYTRPTITYLTKTIKDGINKPTWEPKTTQPDQVSAYVYAALMTLVTIHTEVSTTVMNSGTSNTSLLNEILSYLLENISSALLDGFKERKPNRYTLAALIQATLDTEFIAQTMSQYASKKVGEIQNEIYVELDKRTTNEARADLQKELGVMRGVLKKLRENSRNSFGCFKRPKSDKDRPAVKKQPST